MSAIKRKAARRRPRAATDGENAITFPSLMKSALPALLISVAVGLLLLLLITALLLTTADPNRYYAPAGTAVLYVSALLGGLVTTRLYRCRLPLFCGLLSGALLLAVLLLLAICLPESQNSYGMPLAAGLYALILPCSLAGAMLGAKKRKTHHRRR